MASVSLINVCKSFDNVSNTVNNVSLEIADGEFCVFVGPSGCGKSTLLRMIAGLETITTGELRIGGKRVNDLAPSERDVAMVFQNYALYPHLSVAKNMGFGLRLAGVAKEEISKRVNGIAGMLQIERLLERKPKALSGGQRQRVAIGRALVREPEVFLFDEPLSNLDAALRTQTRVEIAKLHREYARASTIYVTHDQVEAMTLADKIVLLHSGAEVETFGSVAQIGAPIELYERPNSLFVAGFLGSPKMNFLAATVTAIAPDHVDVRTTDGHALTALVAPDALKVGDRVQFGIRPEHIEAGTAGAAHVFTREVQWVERLGESTYAYLRGDTHAPLIARLSASSQVQTGEQLALYAPPAKAHLFDSNGRALERLAV
ncbi:ABC transporter ATP-binding protein [Amantichitinum ursilacus]|uniref:Maltose/maltodextrin import ATP-binding protein MalK n=1 Tax=Amantichitinum ursilacus TaxID=857265 RepID=A0A0N0XIF5_9NEIS|nr:sn-glycerol-3-phosphate ABC transporter ATP-binding protein UgpC [Amantichitinum ursilacus]KPC50642.1 Maltose/maltodextrin import ATP-binding protein MalK [Amantichitinum ursilacus]